MELQDSGNRRAFESGAVRDICEGKGRCDLLPLDIVADIMDDEILCYIDQYVRFGNKTSLVKAIKSFSEARYGTLNTAMLEVSKHYEDGCNKYGERNWQRVFPSTVISTVVYATTSSSPVVTMMNPTTERSCGICSVRCGRRIITPNVATYRSLRRCRNDR